MQIYSTLFILSRDILTSHHTKTYILQKLNQIQSTTLLLECKVMSSLTRSLFKVFISSAREGEKKGNQSESFEIRSLTYIYCSFSRASLLSLSWETPETGTKVWQQDDLRHIKRSSVRPTSTFVIVNNIRFASLTKNLPNYLLSNEVKSIVFQVRDERYSDDTKRCNMLVSKVV